MTEDIKAQSTAFERLVWGVITTLIGAGVIALIVMALTVSRLDERVALWTKIYETRFEGITVEQRELRTRVDRIEQRDAARSGVVPNSGRMGQ
jgi:hypothetical protein